jgi:4-amino-4-deoxy-L-arabinose transferase-like glycosyltransferase
MSAQPARPKVPAAPPAAPAAPAAPIAAPRAAAPARAEWAVLRWLLPFALLHGLLYLAFVPPWQHYDEPTHFEYARMIAEERRISAVGEVTRPTRWQIADSMNRLNFWRGQPQPMVAWDVPFIGYDQRVHPPLYYLVVALPIRAALDQPVEIQLYAARAVSVLLYALSVAAVWRMAVALAPNSPAAQLALPLLYAAVPPFAAIMSAVNSDVMINFTGAALLLACVLLIRDGPRPAHLALALLALAVGVLAKRTALMGAVPLALALLWAFARRPLPRLRWLWLALPAALLLAPLALRVDDSVPHFALGTRPWLSALDNAYLRLDLDRVVHSVSDLSNSGPVYPQLLIVAFLSFWATYGWGDVQLGTLWFWTMAAISAASLVGLVRWALVRPAAAPLWQRRAYWALIALAVTGLGAMVLRLHPLPPYGDYFYIPRGRYLYGILPAVVALIGLGIGALLPAARRELALPALAALLVAADTLGWAGPLIWHYYGGPWPIAVLGADKPGIFGLPPLYLLLAGAYLLALAGAMRRLAAALRR